MPRKTTRPGKLSSRRPRKAAAARSIETSTGLDPALERAHLAAIVETSDDAIISKTLDGRVRSWNAAAERLFGYSAAEIIGQPITTIIPPELHHQEHEIIQTLKQGKRVDHYQTVRVTKDGRRLDVSLTISPVRDATGTVISAAKILRDITATKQAERVLLEEARALDTLNRVGHAVAAELDLDRAVQVVTDAATEISGAAFGAFFYNAYDDKGESYVLYTISGVPREAFAQFPYPRNTALFGPTFRGESIVRCADVTKDSRYGHSAPYHGMPRGHLPVRSYLAVPVHSRAGEVVGGLFFGHPEANVFTERSERLVKGIASQASIALENGRLYQAAQREIAERKRIEADLRRSERIYRAIGDSIDFGTWLCDADGRNVYASESFLRLVGLTQQECSEFGWGGVLHPEDAERTISAWKQCVEGGGTWNMEHRFRGVDGEWHPVLARGVPVRDDSGAVLCWAGINLDIAEIKDAADALREADRRKDEFLAILAHELRNPLAPMRYALAIARQAGRTPEHQRQAEEVFERQLKHMSRLLDDLLDVSRITRGTLEIRKSPIELTSAIAAAIEAARPLIDARKHELALELPEQAVRLEADLVRLSQVFANLLINAAKYTDPGGKLRLRAWVSDGDVAVSVRDNGIGISPEMKPRLFTLFSQARSALERSEGGLGIGLALVKGVVELHGGRVEVHSDGHNAGSEFTVYLRHNAPPAAITGHEGQSPADLDGPRLRVVVADDNRDNADSCALLLRLSGHEVHVAYSGGEALRLASSTQPHVVLLDIGMPELNGYEVARRLRAMSWAQSTLLVAITGWGQQEDRATALEAGFDHHLTKPVDPVDLHGLLADFVRNRQLAS